MYTLSEEKNEKKVDNSNYRERFQFVVRVNDNIICQRYFKINRFNNECLQSKDLFDVLDGAVQLIQRDLEAKSRTYTRATAECRTKMTGFINEEDTSYLEYEPKPWDDTEFVKPWDVTFKFTFIVDDKTIYERIWDGSQYPKYVRNSVDLTNSRSNFPLIQLMNQDKDDLVVEIIKSICNVASNPEDGELRRYIKSEFYENDEAFVKASLKNDYSESEYDLWSCENDKLTSQHVVTDGIKVRRNKEIAEDTSYKYRYTPYSKDYVKMWRNWCFRKYGPVIEN